MISADDLMNAQSTEPKDNELKDTAGGVDCAMYSRFTALYSGNSAVHADRG